MRNRHTAVFIRWGALAVAMAAGSTSAQTVGTSGVTWATGVPLSGEDTPNTTPVGQSLTNAHMITQITQLQRVSFFADFIAIDQPRVAWVLEDPNPVGDQEPEIGPSEFFGYGVLDTGANGVVLGAMSYFEFDWDTFDVGFNYDRFERAVRPGTSDFVQYREIGVAGDELLDVLAPYNLNFRGRSDVTYALPNVNILGAVQRVEGPPETTPNLGQATGAADFGSFSAIIGMPAMVGRVTELDLRPIAGGSDDSNPDIPPFDLMVAEFHSSMPTATANSIDVKLKPLIIPPELSGQLDPSDPLPTFADVPLLSVTAKRIHGGVTTSATKDVLLDTGAQTSILSRTMIQGMGYNLSHDLETTDLVDLSGDGEIDFDDYLEVGGLGGTEFMPLVLVNEFIVMGKNPNNGEDVEIVVRDLVVGVLDIGGEGDAALLNGVFGMNILTSGYGDLIFAGTGEFGRFTKIFFDFTTEGEWVMRLENNPDFAHPAPEPASMGLIFLGGAALLRRRRRR